MSVGRLSLCTLHILWGINIKHACQINVAV
jgi:hypothetical protein